MNFINEEGDNAEIPEMLITKGCEAFKGDDDRLRKCMSVALKNNLQKYMRFGKIESSLNAGRNKFFINIVIEKDGDIFTTNRDIHPKIKKEIERSIKKMKFLNLEVLGDYNSIKFTLPLNIVTKKKGIKAYYDNSQVVIANTEEDLDRLPATGFCKFYKKSDERKSCVKERVIVFLYNSVDRTKLKDVFEEGLNTVEFKFILDQNTQIKNFEMKNKRQIVITSYFKSIVEKINFISPAYVGLKPQEVGFDIKLVYHK
ncbi:hypothetical protein [Flavobacteriaceae bacterium 14752]|uniref:hypothetical protein n=1 Tax=Mesohalobacter salilacus TaxID=2491711 RepID=UPI000F63DD65|nr:hypothetical protein EIG84_01240 [Flavobacteriaceae bacterium 14752]